MKRKNDNQSKETNTVSMLCFFFRFSHRKQSLHSSLGKISNPYILTEALPTGGCCRTKRHSVAHCRRVHALFPLQKEFVGRRDTLQAERHRGVFLLHGLLTWKALRDQNTHQKVPQLLSVSLYFNSPFKWAAGLNAQKQTFYRFNRFVNVLTWHADLQKI